MSIRMGFASGIGAECGPADYWRWIEYCEAAGVDSIWHSDQLLGPTPEPLVMLAALAARTRRMRFGANAIVAPFRDPLTAAKQIATIDSLAPGRMLPIFGVGGASDPFWSATGANPKTRGARGNEAIALIRLLLEQDEVAFDGAHFRHHGAGVRPRPAKPIPLWIGGNSEAALRRTARLGDGWLGSLIGPAEAGIARRRIEEELVEAGRAIDSDHYGVTLFLRAGAADDTAVAATRQRLLSRRGNSSAELPGEAFMVGTADELIGMVRRFVDEGMSKFVAVPMADGGENLMDQTRRLVEEVLPAIENR